MLQRNWHDPYIRMIPCDAGDFFMQKIVTSVQTVPSYCLEQGCNLILTAMHTNTLDILPENVYNRIRILMYAILIPTKG